MVAELRRVSGAREVPATLAERGGNEYLRIRDEVAVRLAQMPLTHLQVVGGVSHPILYDEPWLRPRVSQSLTSLGEHDWSITLSVGHGSRPPPMRSIRRR